MKSFLRLFRSPVPLVTASAAGLVFLAAWAGYKLNAPRILVGAIILAILVIWLLVMWILKLRAAKAGAALEKSLEAQAQSQMSGSRPGREKDIEQLRSQLLEAIAALKTSRVGKGKKGTSALYVLPWYMIIGPPAAGKTTLLQNSGLNFPYLDPARSRSSVRGVGGTRNCDWWFADEAVILDTAGRYVLPVEADDTQEWLGFLDLLRKHRGRKPINGLLVGVSIQDLIGASDDELEDHASKIRSRIDELIKQLGVTFPVYVVFTKCDLIRGFVEFFGDLSRAERTQAWGATVARARAAREPAKQIFEAEMDRLTDAVAAAKIQRLSQVTQPESRPEVLFFPLQFAAVKQRLSHFMEMLFRPNPYQELPIFRGFYFTSGTQEGRPIDQVINAMLKGFGSGTAGEGMYVEPSQTKSYFIEDVFSKIAFPDRFLAGPSNQGEKRRQAMRTKTFLAGGILLSLFLILMISLYNMNRSLVSQVRSLSDRVTSSLHAGQEFLSLEDLKTLDQLRQKLDRMDGRHRPLVKAAFLATYQGEKAAEAARQAHFRVLYNSAFLPAMPLLAGRLRHEAAGEPDYRQYFGWYRTWRLLHNPAALLLRPEDARETATELAGLWSTIDGRADLEGEYQKLMAVQLEYASRHQKIMLDSFRKEDPGVDEAAKVWLRRNWSPAGLYTGLTAAAASLPAIGVSSFTAPDLGVTGTESVPAAFTRDGWRGPVKEYFDWLSGVRNDWAMSDVLGSDPPNVRAGLMDRYADEYERRWVGFLSGARVETGRDDAAMQVFLERAVTESSPILKLLRGVAENTDFGRDSDPGLAPVEDAFRPIQEFLSVPGKAFWPPQRLKGLWSEKKGPVSEYLEQVSRLKDAYADIARSGNPSREKQVLDLEGWVGTRIPTGTPVGDELARLLLFPNAAVTGQAPIRRGGEISSGWGEVYSQFQHLAGLYPFRADARQEVALKDFESFFGPSGTFWSYYKGSLENIVTADGSQELNPDIHLSAQFRACLRRAQRIKNAFFGAGDRASFEISFKPSIPTRPPDSGIVFHSSRLEIGGEALTYSAGQPRPTELRWPGESPMMGASLTLNLGTSATARNLSAEGLWGFFRLLDRAQVTTSPGSAEIVWRVPTDKGDVQVRYEAIGLPTFHPLMPDLLRFSCPERIVAGQP